MDAETELRKLSPGSLFTLVQILEYDESWKRLMAIIPKSLTLDTFESRIAINNLPKYHTEHFKLIENAGCKLKKPCSEILFEEWGTSGRIRPRLGHLLRLLERAQLYRAADYVAEDLLKIPPPNRPLTGPAAKVNTSIDDILPPNSANNNEDIERILDQINYPSSILNTTQSSNLNINHNVQPIKLIIPKIVVNEVSNIDNVSTENNNSTTESYSSSDSSETSLAWREKQLEMKIEKLRYSPQIPENMTQSTNIDSESSASDMMAFSRSDQIPALTSLLNEDQEDNGVTETYNYDIPQISDLMRSAGNIPDFGEITSIKSTNQENVGINDNDLENSKMASNYNLQSSNLPAFSQILNSEQNIPAFSQILQSSTETSNAIPDFNNLISTLNQPVSNEMPNLSDLFPQNTNKNIQTQSMSSGYSNKNIRSQSISSESFLPIVSLLQQSDKMHTAELSNSRKPSLSPISRTTCASPLPNLSLNTVLPHFTYQELDICTGGFEETILSSHHSLYESEPIGRKLGSGAFGTVYLGLGLLDKPVAVKKLNLNGVNVVNVDDTITKQFRNEVELLCKYNHDNLLSLLGYSCDGSTYCLVYEYICGGALKDRLQSTENRLIWTNRLYIALGTARAVSYLHNAYSMPLIHRDIKTANILLDVADKPKLCDFGLIKLTTNQNTNTSTTVFGTSAYMAPEAFRGDTSVKLDVFSFGVVLLELLTGLPPLDENREGNDLVTHVEEVCEDDIKPLLDTRAGTWTNQKEHFGEELFKIALQCLEEKKRRPVMADVVSQLSQLIDKTN